MIHILEDDINIAKNLILNMKLDGHKVTWSQSIEEAKENINSNNFSIMIFDVNLPDGSSFNLCKSIREQKNTTPVIFLTAQSDEDSVIAGFNVGGNDYIKKPFNLNELRARIGAWIKFSSNTKSEVIADNELSINKENRTVYIKDEEVKLNRREYDMLNFLLSRVDAIVTREDIINAINLDLDVNDRTIDTHVSRLRSKLKKANLESYQINSEYGIGYRMVKVD